MVKSVPSPGNAVPSHKAANSPTCYFAKRKPTCRPFEDPRHTWNTNSIFTKLGLCPRVVVPTVGAPVPILGPGKHELQSTKSHGQKPRTSWRTTITSVNSVRDSISARPRTRKGEDRRTRSGLRATASTAEPTALPWPRPQRPAARPIRDRRRSAPD